MENQATNEERLRLLRLQLAERVSRDEIRPEELDFKFSSNADLLLTVGRPMGNGESFPVAKRGKRGECYVNARRLAQQRKALSYCEGFAMPPDRTAIYDHAWCISKTGQVIDPTWPRAEEVVYFGIEIPTPIREEAWNEFRLEDGVLRSDYLYGHRLMREGDQLLGQGNEGREL